jgi:hypothetical protein
MINNYSQQEMKTHVIKLIVVFRQDLILNHQHKKIFRRQTITIFENEEELINTVLESD